MNKRVLLLFLFSVVMKGLLAQTGDLTVLGVSPDLYLQHTVAAKENWYSVGRLYNISPKEIAPVNGATLDKPLAIDQQIRIPLTATNFTQRGAAAGEEVFVPVYHVVQDKEWMFRISTNYNKVPVENLETWNNIGRDQAKAGMKLIVGFLKVKKDLSALAVKGAETVAGSSATAGTTGTTTTPVTTAPAATTPVTTTAPAATPPVATSPVKTMPPSIENQVVTEKQPVAETNQPVAVAKTVMQPAANTVAGGYFKTMYEESGKSANGSAGVFKSTSGWQDGKYYALMNNVSIGTIVRVSNPSTSKVVYAKVLGQLPDMKESVGLTVRVSDAAATELGSSVTKFAVEVKY